MEGELLWRTGQIKPLEWSLPSKIANQNKTHSWNDCWDLCHHQGFEGCGDIYSHDISINFHISLVQKSYGSCLMAVEYYKFNQVANPNFNCCSRSGIIAWANQHIHWYLLCSYSQFWLIKSTRNNILSAGMTSNPHSLSYWISLSIPEMRWHYKGDLLRAKAYSYEAVKILKSRH